LGHQHAPHNSSVGLGHRHDQLKQLQVYTCTYNSLAQLSFLKYMFGSKSTTQTLTIISQVYYSNVFLRWEYPTLTMGNHRFVECQKHSTKAQKHSKKGFAESHPRQRAQGKLWSENNLFTESRLSGTRQTIAKCPMECTRQTPKHSACCRFPVMSRVLALPLRCKH
jgi:hypothetical protein